MVSPRLREARRGGNQEQRLFDACGLVFKRDGIRRRGSLDTGWWDVTTPEGEVVYHTYRGRLDAAYLAFASALGYSIRQMAGFPPYFSRGGAA